MLTVGQSHTPGTFLGFFLLEVAGMIISIVMLRSNIFSKINAYAGILGFSNLAGYRVLFIFFGIERCDDDALHGRRAFEYGLVHLDR